jgi:hypothetical protein
MFLYLSEYQKGPPVAGEPVDRQRRIARGDSSLSDDRKRPDDSARVRLD